MMSSCAITIEVSNRQVVRAAVHGVSSSAVPKLGVAVAFVEQNIDSIIRRAGGCQIRESVPVKVAEGYRTYLAGSGVGRR